MHIMHTTTLEYAYERTYESLAGETYSRVVRSPLRGPLASPLFFFLISYVPSPG